MNKALQVLIIIGMALWIFLLMEKYHMFNGVTGFWRPRVQDATKDERCAHFAKESEGGKSMEYADRIRQLGSGCW